MNKENWLTALFSGLAFVIGMFWGLNEGYDGMPHHSEQQQVEADFNYYQEQGLVLQRQDLFAQRAMAIFTIALFIVAIVSLRSGNQMAAQVLRETRNSNQNYVRNERGMLAFAENQLTANIPNRTIDYTYRNIGNGPLTIERVRMILDEVPIASGNSTASHPRAANTFITIAAGDPFTSWDHDGMTASMRGLGYPIESDVVNRFGTGEFNWRIAIEVRYRLPVGAVYLNRMSWFLNAPSETGPNTMRVELGNDITFDRMVIDENGREVGVTANT